MQAISKRFSRSWHLVLASLEVLKQDRELLVFPLISSLSVLVVAGTFMSIIELDSTVSLFLLYLAEYFVIVFFNTALVGCALIRLGGGDPTVMDGFRIASSKIGIIAGYAAIAATVGVILRTVGERLGLLGGIVAAMAGLGWTVVSFLVVPVLVSRNVGPVKAVRESAALVKKTWGENVIGNIGLGFVFGVFYFILALFVFLLAMLAVGSNSSELLIMLLLLGGMVGLLLAAIHASLHAIYSAALYRQATGELDTPGFSPEMLQDAFRRRK